MKINAPSLSSILSPSLRQPDSNSTRSELAGSRTSFSAVFHRDSSSRPSSSCLRSSSLLRRSRSIARYFAEAINQAPGLSGTPVFGHCSSAATSASCARSSARPTSRTMRARPAMILADSILQTALIARCVAETDTSTNLRLFPRSCRYRRRRLLRRLKSSPRIS